jgi:hypothetical protein
LLAARAEGSPRGQTIRGSRQHSTGFEWVDSETRGLQRGPHLAPPSFGNCGQLTGAQGARKAARSCLQN